MYARSEGGKVLRLLRWLVNADLKMNDLKKKVAYFIPKYLLHLKFVFLSGHSLVMWPT